MRRDCGDSQTFSGGKVIYLIPLKAIAEEKYCDFCDKYAPLRIKILISTKDHPESDLELDCGNFDLAFVVYEKFNQLPIRNPGIIARLALIIVDEVQLLLDPSRGPVLERALAKVRLRGVHIQVVALSSALHQSGDVADWLRCALLHKTHRPVELLQGVLWKGTFRYRKYNAHTEGVEDLHWLEHSNTGNLIHKSPQSFGAGRTNPGFP